MWKVSISPHLKSSESVEKIMWTVVACLVPSLILSVFVFGIQTLIITAVSVISCVVVEAVSQKTLGRKVTIKDGSAVLTGLLLAFVIPPGVSPLLPILAAVFAIYIGKHLLGGIGYNFFNPALLGRAFLLASFPVAMTSAWLTPIEGFDIFSHLGRSIDAVSTATPLAVLKEQGMVAFTNAFGSGASLYTNFFLGWRPGCIGETSGFLLVLGGLYLIYRGYITWHIPVSLLGTIAVLTWIFGGESYFTGDPLLALLSGGALLGAFYMATDYVTSPTTKTSKIIFGIGIGGLTVLIRLKGGYPEGICYAILLMNPLSTVLDSWFKPKRFAPPAGGTK
ncbi:MAG: RnfABCDGE type electron transport complex subunit D [Proteobacteria bacterium]|nr:RnfABCDGE type electron transport complex subunit D [Pseudomonadota bacterium]MBU1420167.1 RnfABCDGE type electron transport complex subunit D [Pseudomonadota bacterium]MBU1456274.1 RnfABCDGE type electron transport complex subunit D [Pseudomonadota bacterium]